jgi:hypothetical protein
MTPGTGPHQSGPSQDGTLEKRYDTQLATTRAYAAEARRADFVDRTRRSRRNPSWVWLSCAQFGFIENHLVDPYRDIDIDTLLSIGQDIRRTRRFARLLRCSIVLSIKNLDGQLRCMAQYSNPDLSSSARAHATSAATISFSSSKKFIWPLFPCNQITK